jgi:hypothetical protein
MIPDSLVPQGKRGNERLLNGLSSRPEGQSSVSAMPPSSQVALVCRPASPRVPMRPLRTTGAAGPSPAGLQPCRLLTRRPRAALAPPVNSVSSLLAPYPAPALAEPALKYSVMIPRLRAQRGKRPRERLLNALSLRLEDDSPASTTLPTCQVALMADLLRPTGLAARASCSRLYSTTCSGGCQWSRPHPKRVEKVFAA